jgi:hypothetical protein
MYSMMMWQMNRGTCVALHTHPIKLNPNLESFLALADGYKLQQAT